MKNSFIVLSIIVLFCSCNCKDEASNLRPMRVINVKDDIISVKYLDTMYQVGDKIRIGKDSINYQILSK